MISTGPANLPATASGKNYWRGPHAQKNEWWYFCWCHWGGHHIQRLHLRGLVHLLHLYHGRYIHKTNPYKKCKNLSNIEEDVIFIWRSGWCHRLSDISTGPANLPATAGGKNYWRGPHAQKNEWWYFCWCHWSKNNENNSGQIQHALECIDEVQRRANSTVTETQALQLHQSQ